MPKIWSANQLGSRVVYTLAEAANRIADTNAASLLVPLITVPANFMTAGRAMRATLAGTVSNVVTTPGTLTFSVRWGGTSATTGTVLAISAGMNQTAVATTDVGWWLTWNMVCMSAGTAGVIQCTGTSHRANRLVAAAGDAIPDLIPADDASLGYSTPNTINTTVDSNLAFIAKFSVNTSGTNIQCYNFILEALN